MPQKKPFVTLAQARAIAAEIPTPFHLYDEAGIHNLFELYLPISDYWMITDNSMSPMEVIAKGFKNDKREVYNLDIFTKLEHHE